MARTVGTPKAMMASMKVNHWYEYTRRCPLGTMELQYVLQWGPSQVCSPRLVVRIG